MGGFDKNIKSHTRYYAFIIIEKVSPDVGYFAFTNFFDNLFKYINEVSFSSLAFPMLKNKIAHQYSITKTLYQMTDVFTTIKDESKFVLA